MQIVKTDGLSSNLNTVLALNAFDAVVALKIQQEQYFVELMNTRASVLFNKEAGEDIRADLFFGEDWQQFLACIHSTNERVNRLNLSSEQSLYVCVKHYTIEEQQYILLIMRTKDSASEVNESADAIIPRYMNFIGEYIEPIVTVDLEGCIVGLNKAAINFIGGEPSIVGGYIHTYIHEQSRQQFNHMFAMAKEGHFVNIVKIELESSIKNLVEVNMTMMPTYGEGKIIGSHLIIKNSNNQMTQYLSAYEDELTGLLNRKSLNERWPTIAYTSKYQNIALILVDIDRFKRFNESLGKQKADEMLADICRRYTKLTDIIYEVYRYNGDECVFVVQFDELAEVELAAAQILQLLRDPIIVDKQEYFVTASIGIATMQKAEANLESMLHKADQALFNVKTNGRAHYRFYEEEMSRTFPNDALMEAHLKRAIEFNELNVYLQPQLNLETNTIDSFEALMRWNNRKFGQVQPSQFIPLAESSGLIHQLGDWILEEVLKYLQQWKLSNYRPVRIAVNISPKQFKQNGFVERVQFLLDKYEVEPTCLELEITESSMTNVKETIEILKRLKEIGVFVSVDDFGTGYSSLSYLTTYPIDIIKIDQSFIADMSKGKKNEALVKAIINLSQNLGLEVIAEGVEDKEQEEFLMNNKCKKVQGYLYNKPMPIDQMAKKYLA